MILDQNWYQGCGEELFGTEGEKQQQLARMEQSGEYYVGRNFQRYEGRVVVIHGYGRFESGAVRHPSLIRFRWDKDPQECVFDKTHCAGSGIFNGISG